VIQTALALLLSQAAPYQAGPAPQPPAAYQVTPEAGAGYTLAPEMRAPPPELARTGVLVDAYDKRVESRWGADDPFYAGTIRGGAAAAQSRLGQLDGGWTVAAADGAPIYALQLVDAGEGVLEGAWRDVQIGTAAPRPTRSGFIALIGRDAGRVVMRFLEPGAPAPTAVTLELAADGSWRGELARANGAILPVTMRR